MFQILHTTGKISSSAAIQKHSIIYVWTKSSSMRRIHMKHSNSPSQPNNNNNNNKSSMASSLFFSNPRPFRPPLNPNSNPHLVFPLRTLNFSAKSTPPTPLPPPPEPAAEKKSFAVATGELFLGIASRVLRRGNSIVNGWNEEQAAGGVGVSMFKDDEQSESYFLRRRKEGIASVVEDPVQPEVVWEQTEKDVEAEKKRKKVTSPGFSFSAAGLLFPYHLGVAKLLIEKGYIKETTPLAGSSAGAIVCAVVASGASMQEALDATKILAQDCRLKGTAFRLGAVLREVLEKFLPDDAHIRCNGRVRVAVTQILWRPRGLLVDQFDSREDLINAVFTSSFIPGYLAPRPATFFRNRLCIDGGLTLFMPPTSAAQTVRVCAFPAGRLGLQGIGISPDRNPENRATPRQLLNWALEPAEDDILDKLFELGYADAAVWAQENPVEDIVRDDNSSFGSSLVQ
ncbi:patatin-like phospholipase domain-containing protein 2 [Capsicum chacoense]